MRQQKKLENIKGFKGQRSYKVHIKEIIYNKNQVILQKQAKEIKV